MIRSPKVGMGLPLWEPESAQRRIKFEETVCQALTVAGFRRVYTPHAHSYDHEPEIQVCSPPHWGGWSGDHTLLPRTPDRHPDSPPGVVFDTVQPRGYCCFGHYLIYREVMQQVQFSYQHLPLRVFEIGEFYHWDHTQPPGEQARVTSRVMIHVFCTPAQGGMEIDHAAAVAMGLVPGREPHGVIDATTARALSGKGWGLEYVKADNTKAPVTILHMDLFGEGLESLIAGA